MVVDDSLFEDFKQKYVMVLPENKSDIYEKLLLKGECIIYNPEYPDEIMEYTENNRIWFIEHEYCWSDTARAHLYYPAGINPHEKEYLNYEEDHSACMRYMYAVNENMNELQKNKKPLPDIKLPKWMSGLFWTPRINKVNCLINLKHILIEKLRIASDGFEGVKYPDNILNHQNEVNDYRIYEISGMGVTFNVVSAYVSPVQFSDKKPEKLLPGVREINTVKDIYREWLKDKKKPLFTFYTIGCYKDWNKDLDAGMDATGFVLLSSLEGSGEDRFINTPKRAKYDSERRYLRNFIDYLYPETYIQMVNVTRLMIDEYLNYHEAAGNITVNMVVRKLGYRRKNVYEIFNTLQDDGNYKGYIVKDKLKKNKEQAIKKGEGKGIRFGRKEKFIAKLFWRVFPSALSFFLLTINSKFVNQNYYLNLVILGAVGYISNFLINVFERLRHEKSIV